LVAIVDDAARRASVFGGATPEMTLNSRIESCGGEMATPPKSPMVFVTPSRRISFEEARPPLTKSSSRKSCGCRLTRPRRLDCRPPFPHQSCRGTRLTKLKMLRSAVGKSSMSFCSIVVSKFDVSVCRIGVSLLSTVTSTVAATDSERHVNARRLRDFEPHVFAHRIGETGLAIVTL
jgi:hypothetical protein